MSHEHLRKERDCLNCGATVAGDYCQNCGQRNVVPRQTFWHLITHFFNDITHFDGKFFSTMKLLLFRPGFLSSEWVKGRRTKYLDPIRMYLFISAAFFILIPSLFSVDAPRHYSRDSYEAKYLDTVRQKARQEGGYHFSWYYLPEDTTGNGVFVLDYGDEIPETIAGYETEQRTLPQQKRDDFLTRFLKRRAIMAYQVYDYDPFTFWPRMLDIFTHSFSKIFFISLPLFAFFLWLLYLRSRKQYYFVSHAIFSIHYYSVSFIFLAVFFACANLVNSTDSESLWVDIFGIISTLLLAIMPVYLFLSMKKFYEQHWFKTLLKTLILSLVNTTALLILVTAFFFNSFISMGSH